MASSDHLLRALTAAAETGAPTEVETILGRFPPNIRAGVAKTAAGIAFRSERWDNVAYLADFLHDTSAARPLGGAGEDELAGDSGDEDKLADDSGGAAMNIMAHIVCGDEDERGDEDEWDVLRGADDAEPAAIRSPSDKNIATAIVDWRDPAPQAIAFRSRTDHRHKICRGTPATTPSSAAASFDEDASSDHVALSADIGDRIASANDRVIDEERIRVLYSYPLGTAGPTALEQELGGWIFEERAGNGPHFTRAGLARAVAARYAEIYAEEARTSSRRSDYVPGPLARAATDGKYRIWGHDLPDLDLHAAVRDRESGVFVLDVGA